MRKLNGLDLFSGIGGITLALKDYVEPIAYVEINEYCQKIIAYRMADGSIPRAPILADIKNIQGEIGLCDIITGGFPCQDISVAGTGKGLEGQRSGLFYEIIRLTKEIRPSFVFLENVPAIRTKGLEQVVKEFTQIGYDCRWTCLSAASIGAPHKRERWFLLANTDSPGISQQSRRQTGESWKDQAVFKCDGKKESVADSDSSRCKWKNTPQSEVWRRDFKLAWSSDNKRWHDSESWWEIEPNVGRVVDGHTERLDFNRQRLHALGNGVVPFQVRKAFEVLIGL